MERLLDLGKLATDLVNKYQTLYEGNEIELPNEFKNKVKVINDNPVVYQKYTAIVTIKKSGLNIYLPNHWFFIASFFTEYYNELQRYKEIVCDLFSLERIKELNGKLLTDKEEKQISQLDIEDESKKFIKSFLTDYKWWGGGKTIDRVDFYVSPILNYAKLVNASQSYVAELCAFLSQNKTLVDCLFKEIDNNKIMQKEEILFGPTKYGSNTDGFVSFLSKVLSFILKEDPSLSRLTSIKDNYSITQDSFSVGCVIGKNIKSKDKLRPSDYDETVTWNFKNETYIFWKELTQNSILKFSEKFNFAYKGLYKIESEPDGKNYIFKLVKCGTIIPDTYKNCLASLRTKPFLLLAGISGTGKSRVVKQMAFESCPNIPNLRADKTSPGNYQLIEVKPNWHDSTELLGYESEIGEVPHYVLTPFVKFLVKAMMYEDKAPFFVCMDEMNLAPVEQYFAEYLSVLESRKLVGGKITSEPLVKAYIFEKYEDKLKEELFGKSKDEDVEGQDEECVPYETLVDKIYERLKQDGLRLPSNLLVIGTVNMDETTHQFSRKVIDRAMTIEMNIEDAETPFVNFFKERKDLDYSDVPQAIELFLPTAVQAKEAVANLSVDDSDYLEKEVPAKLYNLNQALNGTPFKIAYRVQNELVIYFYELRKEQSKATNEKLLAEAFDAILMQKVLPRVEGDEDLLEKPLEKLADFTVSYKKANDKVKEMQERLKRAHFTSFWP